MRVQQTQYAGKTCARLVILKALQDAGAKGVALKELLALHSKSAMLKALTQGRQAGEWFSHKMRTDETKHAAHYWLKREDMEASRAACAAAQKIARRQAETLRCRVYRQAKRAGLVKPRPVKAEKPMQAQKEPKAPKPPKLVKVTAAKPPKPPKAAKPPKVLKLAPSKPKEAVCPFKDAPATNPRNVKPVALPGCQVERFKPTGEERFFSSLAVGNYLRSDSALARAYAQGGAL